VEELHADLKHKILDMPALQAAVGARPRQAQVVLCHGTFDIVHPGHVRHLHYAKQQGHVLVVSLTADQFVDKGASRPYVPEGLRALNLAALAMVDYVHIDRHATPIQLLSDLRPDILVKGYEYQTHRAGEKTAEERRTVESYGGAMHFSPADLVMSSSAIIEGEQRPDLRRDRLQSVLSAETLERADFETALDGIAPLRVHVVGDTIIDRVTTASYSGSMAKTPTISARFEKEVGFVGGAGVVARHMRAAGAQVTFSTVVGEDHNAELLRETMAADGIVLNALVDPGRPTTEKHAYEVSGYRMLKVDRVNSSPIAPTVLKQLAELVASPDFDVVVFSDFRHGIFSPESIPVLLEAIPGGVFKAADSQVASRWGNIADFPGMDLVTPNEREARHALRDQDTGVRALGEHLKREIDAKTLILTVGEEGSLVFRRAMQGESDPRHFVFVDSFAEHVVDAVGSGDALLSYATVALAASGNPVIAGILGSIAAGLECGFAGNHPVTAADVRTRLTELGI
jgi:rfaE bifunctional protein kinase chain/domain/rfaE bifunctional protein nucleotidyltransferase chain/domain